MATGTASWLIPLIVGAAGAGTSIAATASARRSAKEALAAQQEENAAGRLLSEEQMRQRTALDESLADPFRHAMQQQNALGRLDMISRFNPTPIQVPDSLRGYAPTMAPSYSASPDMRSWATAAQREIAAGRGTAPTMTDPTNYGRTGALDLMSLAAGKPSTVGAASTPNTELNDPFQMYDYFSSTPDRNEGAGGVWSGVKKGVGMTAGTMNPYAIGAGAVIGGIAGAFTKHAKTAKTDKSVADARRIVAEMFRREAGREATPEEIEMALQGQGLKPGDRWVGRGGLESIASSLRSQRPRAA